LPPSQPGIAVIIDGDDFASRVSKITHSLGANVPSLKFSSSRQLLLALARVLKLVSKHSESPKSKIQFRKIFSRFCQFVEDNEGSVSVANSDQPEVSPTC